MLYSKILYDRLFLMVSPRSRLCYQTKSWLLYIKKAYRSRM